jgi:RND superfamily putative drug exporter
MTALGPIGRLGRWTATHFKTVAAAWVVIALGLGFLAPRAENALSGAGWEATGSESVQARHVIDRNFNGLGSYGLVVVVHAESKSVSDPAFRRALSGVQAKLTSSTAVTTVARPRVSPNRHTAVIHAGAARNADEMVRAAGELKGPLAKLGSAGVKVNLTGASGMWSDFNEANRSAMLKSELISWPVTLAILALAFGSLIAAGLPLMLTIAGLIAAAGSLWIGTRIAGISIWAMNFALMFALALGIDYALFIVYRFRGAFFDSKLPAEEAVAETMDSAGKAVLFSAMTVLVSLSAVMLVPSPAFRSTSLGIMLSVVFVLAATLTLLPAVLAKLGPRVNKFALRRSAPAGEARSPRSTAWAERLWRRPLPYGLAAVVLLVALALPVLSLKTGMPSIKVVPSSDNSREGYYAVQKAFGPGSTGPLQIVVPKAEAARAAEGARRDAGVAQVVPPQPGGSGMALVQAIPSTDPSATATGDTIDRLRAALPRAALVGGPVAENHDLEATLSAKTPLVIGVVLLLSFMLLVVALRAPVIAALGVVTNLLATGAAFGIAKWIFQDGAGHSLLGFEPQGFLDAWGPVFFFAMIFAISMDYTVFLLSSAKEHWESSGDAKTAMVGGMARSGRVIFAGGAVMVAVFFTFALSGPLPPKEMGVILGVAVLLDAFLVRLLLVPVLLRLLGKWAWYAPSPLSRAGRGGRAARAGAAPPLPAAAAGRSAGRS